MPHHIKPSELLLVGESPLRAVFGDKHLEQAVALLVCILGLHGDTFRPVPHTELCAFFDEMLAAPELCPRWLVVPDFDPDWERLARAGMMAWVGREDPKGMELTAKAIDKLRGCAFCRVAPHVEGARR